MTTLPMPNRRRTDAVQKLIIYAVLVAGAVIVLFPFLWTFSTSLKTPEQVYQIPPQLIPDPIAPENYSRVVTDRPFGRWMLNSLFVVVVSTVGTLLSCSLAAFAFSRLRWPGRDKLFLVLLATMMLPTQVTLIPTFILFKELGWVNTYFPLALPAWFARNAFYVFLLRQFFMTIPLDLDDAARMDGANNFQVYWRIILPMSKPALGVAALMFAQFKWREFLAPLIYLNRRESLLASIGLRTFMDETHGTDWELMMAANIMFMVPVVVVFFFTQRYMIQGVVISGVKG
ncbi:MAG: carbohydrate ABC transporter permease [Chloroflexi bacterium]|nr:carbohydrate ABC transporter permease [Chloroflexota bacterium]